MFKGKLHKYERLLKEYSDLLDYVSIHAPSDSTISHVTDQSHRKIALACLEKLIVLASRIGCRRVVFHGFHPITRLDSIREMRSLRDKALQNCAMGVKSLNELCHKSEVTLCLENINACARLDRLYYLVFSASPFDLLDAVEKLDSEAFRLCFDVAHAYHTCNFVHENPKMSKVLRFSELSVEAFYKIIARHVDIIHLTDAKGAVGAKNTEHLPPKKGEINFRRIMKAILKNNFGGPIVLEMDELDFNNALSMARSRDYLLGLLANLPSQKD